MGKRKEKPQQCYYCMCGMWFVYKKTLDLHIDVSKPRQPTVYVRHREITKAEWQELKPQ